MSSKIKIGIVGTGRMGSLHLSKFLSLPTVEVVGFFEANTQRAKQISGELSVNAFSSLEELIFNVDGLIIASPTQTHFEIAKRALSQGCHVLIEKPFCETLDEAHQLVRLSKEKKLVCQIGFLERFRYVNLMGAHNIPKSSQIYAQRLSKTIGREVSVDVVSDLMIHDIDLILSLTNEYPVAVSAFGAPVVTDYLDFATTRLEFPSGIVAELSASRISSIQKRGLQIVSPGYSCELDFVSNTKFSVARLGGEMQSKASVQFDALTEQAINFVEAIRGQSRPKVTAEEGARVLGLVEKIRAAILGESTNLLLRKSFESLTSVREH